MIERLYTTVIAWIIECVEHVIGLSCSLIVNRFFSFLFLLSLLMNKDVYILHCSLMCVTAAMISIAISLAVRMHFVYHIIDIVSQSLF